MKKNTKLFFKIAYNIQGKHLYYILIKVKSNSKAEFNHCSEPYK